MKRFRISTLMILVVIAALSTALAVQQTRAARREAELYTGWTCKHIRHVPTLCSVGSSPNVRNEIQEPGLNHFILELNLYVPVVGSKMSRLPALGFSVAD